MIDEVKDYRKITSGGLITIMVSSDRFEGTLKIKSLKITKLIVPKNSLVTKTEIFYRNDVQNHSTCAHRLEKNSNNNNDR